MSRNIGVHFDKKMSFDKCVNSVCTVSLPCSILEIIIAKIRNYLTTESTKTLVHFLVACQLDNCNFLLTEST